MGKTVVRAFAKTDAGLVRETNEDAVAMADLSTAGQWTGEEMVNWSTAPSGVLLSVSDGMGGAKAGEVASALSVRGLMEEMLAAAKRGLPDGDALRQAVERASYQVYEASRGRPDRRGMGATLTAVLLRESTAYIAQIGDSRAYLLRGGRIGQVTHDQSYVQMLVDAGVMTPEEASQSPRKNIILQVMGQEAVRVALGRIDVAPGDRLILCSDGLTNVIDDDALQRTVLPPKSVEQVCEELVEMTLEGGAPDNVTVIVAEIGAPETASGG